MFLLTVEGRESCFVEELRERWGEQMEAASFECPECGGRLRVREGPYGKFWGCENYRATGCRFTRRISPKRSARDNDVSVWFNDDALGGEQAQPRRR